MTSRIAVISPFLFRATRGVERFTVFLANALSAGGDRVEVFAWRVPQMIQWQDIHPAVRIRLVPYSRYYMSLVASVWYLFWLLLRRYDWLVLFFASHGELPPVRLASLLRKFRVLVIFQYPPEAAHHQYQAFRAYGIGRHGETFVSSSTFLTERVSALLEHPCTLVYNGVNTEWLAPSEELRSQARAKLGIGTEAPVALVVAAMEERKGIQWVVKAMPLVRARLPQATLLILGDGPLAPALRQQAASLELGSAVRFLGTTNELKPYYAAADVGMLLSRGEGMPLVLLEYLAMGLPVITSRHRPFDELVEERFGVLVDESDETAVANAMIGLLADAERRRCMSDCARTAAEDRYDWKVIGRQYCDLLHKDDPLPSR
ncbi:MAG TPA: glycosyltransferase family 4 protein [Bacteroidota bacterium]